MLLKDFLRGFFEKAGRGESCGAGFIKTEAKTAGTGKRKHVLVQRELDKSTS